MDRLAQLEIFSKVVERGSFSRAARDLGITQPTASKAVGGLEAGLRARLLQRSTRTLTVTDAGRRFYQRCRTVLDTLEEARAEAAEADAPRGVLRLHGPVVLGELFLGPAAVAFQRRWPAVRCDLTFLDSYVDLVAEGADLSIRLGQVTDPSLVRRPLGRLRRLLVAAPRHLREAGVPRTPADLARHPAVRFSGLPTGNALTLLGPRGPVTAELAPGFLSNNAIALRAALVGGLGVGLTFEWLVERELRAGRLVEVLPRFPCVPLEMSAVFASGRFIPLRARAFLDFLPGFLRGTPGIELASAAR